MNHFYDFKMSTNTKNRKNTYRKHMFFFYLNAQCNKEHTYGLVMRAVTRFARGAG